MGQLNLPPMTGRSRPATGMSQKENMGGAEVWRDTGGSVTDTARQREEMEWQLEVPFSTLRRSLLGACCVPCGVLYALQYPLLWP